jgi:hypothetical protein
MQKLVIPAAHYPKFEAYLNLSNTEKQTLLTAFQNIAIGVSPSASIELLAAQLKDFSKDLIADIYQIYYSLAQSKDNLKLSTTEFLIVLKNALIQTNQPNLQPNNNIMKDFELLLSQPNNTITTKKLIDLMLDNPKNFVKSTVHQDVRQAFDDEQNFIGGLIIHNLKITFKEDNQSKDFFVSLDDSDIEQLLDILKSAQQKAIVLKTNLNIGKILEVK